MLASNLLGDLPCLPGHPVVVSMPNQLSHIHLDEVSLVDHPANAEIDPVTGQKIPRAVVALWKRDGAVAKGVKYLVTEDDGTAHLPYTGPDGKPDHRLMGAAWAALHGGYRGNRYEGPNQQAALTRLKQVYESEGMDTPAQKADQGVPPEVTRKGAPNMTIEQIEAKLGEQDAAIAKIQSENDALKTENETVLKMSTVERAAYAGMDANQRKEFLAADVAKRKEMCGKATGDCGDDDEEEMMEKAQKRDERIAKAESELAETQAQLAAIQKRERLGRFVRKAETELPHTPGSPEEKGARLMKMADALGGEDSDDFKAAFGVMREADRALAMRFTEFGKGALPNASSAEGQLDVLADNIAKRDRISKADAYVKAAEENPAIWRQFNEEFGRAHRGN